MAPCGSFLCHLIKHLVCVTRAPHTLATAHETKAETRQFLLCDHVTKPVRRLLFHDQARSSFSMTRWTHMTRCATPSLPPSIQPLSLKQLTEGLRDTKSSRTVNISKLFTNVLYLPVPKEEQHMRIFNNQIEEDKKIIVPRDKPY